MILSNQVRCSRCDDTPFSGSRHSFVTCKCGNIAVDGGMDYLRRVGNVHGGYTDMSIEWPDQACKTAMDAIALAQRVDASTETLIGYVMSTLYRDGISYSEGEGNYAFINTALLTVVQSAIDTGRNRLGILCAIARAVRDGGGVWTIPVVTAPDSPEEWELEQACFHYANDPDTPEEIRALVSRLWREVCAREEAISKGSAHV